MIAVNFQQPRNWDPQGLLISSSLSQQKADMHRSNEEKMCCCGAGALTQCSSADEFCLMGFAMFIISIRSFLPVHYSHKLDQLGEGFDGCCARSAGGNFCIGAGGQSSCKGQPAGIMPIEV